MLAAVVDTGRYHSVLKDTLEEIFNSTKGIRDWYPTQG